MITAQDISAFKDFLDNEGVLTVELFGETRILQKVGGYYTLYAPESTMQSPMTVQAALENLLTWRRLQIRRHEEMQRRSFKFDVVVLERSA